MLFETSKKEHVLLKTALLCCKNIGEDKYEFETNIYPAYLIVKKYFTFPYFCRGLYKEWTSGFS